MKLSDDEIQERVRRALFELADTVPVDDGLRERAEAAAPASLTRSRRLPTRPWLVAASLVVLAGAAVALGFTSSRSPSPRVVPGTQTDDTAVVAVTEVVVGRVSAFPVGTATPIPAYHLFISHDPNVGLLALAPRPNSFCQTIRVSDFDATNEPVQRPPATAGAVFLIADRSPDPHPELHSCPRTEYALDGTVVSGDAATRGMSRYSLRVVNGDVIVDLSFAVPGARFDRSPDPADLIGRRGPTGGRAVSWRNVVVTESTGHFQLNPELPVEVLGAFEDANGVVSVALTFDEYLGELQVLPAGAAPLAIVDGTLVQDTVTSSGRVVVVEPTAGNPRASAELALSDGRRLRLVLGGAPAANPPDRSLMTIFLRNVAERAVAVDVK